MRVVLENGKGRGGVRTKECQWSKGGETETSGLPHKSSWTCRQVEGQAEDSQAGGDGDVCECVYELCEFIEATRYVGARVREEEEGAVQREQGRQQNTNTAGAAADLA
jgi:hypothetical protein